METETRVRYVINRKGFYIHSGDLLKVIKELAGESNETIRKFIEKFIIGVVNKEN